MSIEEMAQAHLNTIQQAIAELEGQKVTIDNEILVIPIAAGNRHYDAVQKWVAEGNTIKAAD